jgi:ABC-type Na+ efflux pump permease subunit
VVLRPTFSEKVNACSFLADGINPLDRDGVDLTKVEVDLLKDAKQPGASSIIEQVVQGTMLRVLMPWMISRAFEKLSEKEFIALLGDKVRLPVPGGAEFLFALKGIKLRDGQASLNEALKAAAPDDKALDRYRAKVGVGVQEALREQFRKYNLTGRTWAALTKAEDQPASQPAQTTEYRNLDGSGLLKRGAQRYQVLVPSYTVMFAFFLVMNVGWIFVAERRQGTLKRLRAAPLTRGQILLGKLIPCFLLSLGQGIFLLIAGRLLFGMRWGPESWSLGQQVMCLLPVVFCTSLAAMGLAMLVAALARTEIQVALYGAVPVLILALIGGCVLPREMMPEQAQHFTFLTPQGWALDAYRELLDADPTYTPNLTIVGRACAVLSGFGLAFLGLAWGLLRLD